MTPRLNEKRKKRRIYLLICGTRMRSIGLTPGTHARILHVEFGQYLIEFHRPKPLYRRSIHTYVFIHVHMFASYHEYVPYTYYGIARDPWGWYRYYLTCHTRECHWLPILASVHVPSIGYPSGLPPRARWKLE